MTSSPYNKNHKNVVCSANCITPFLLSVLWMKWNILLYTIRMLWYSNKIKKTSLTHLTKEFADYLKVMRHVWNGLGLACEIIANCTLKFRAGRSSEYLSEQVLHLLLSKLGKALFLHEQFKCYFSIQACFNHNRFATFIVGYLVFLMVWGQMFFQWNK